MKKFLNNIFTVAKNTQQSASDRNRENNPDKNLSVNNERPNSRTYKMDPINYWSGPHFLFYINPVK